MQRTQRTTKKNKNASDFLSLRLGGFAREKD
jgi:hypothetical protein